MFIVGYINCMVCGGKAYIKEESIEFGEMEKYGFPNDEIKAMCHNCGTEYTIYSQKRNIDKIKHCEERTL